MTGSQENLQLKISFASSKSKCVAFRNHMESGIPRQTERSRPCIGLSQNVVGKGISHYVILVSGNSYMYVHFLDKCNSLKTIFVSDIRFFRLPVRRCFYHIDVPYDFNRSRYFLKCYLCDFVISTPETYPVLCAYSIFFQKYDFSYFCEKYS